MTDLKRKCNDDDSRDEESTKLLLSTVAHLLGFDERADGKLEIADVDHSTRRRDTVDIENVNTEYAKHWKPGALLDAVADLNIIPDSEISMIKEELNIGKVSTSQFSSSLAVQGQSSSPQLPPPQTGNSFKQPPAPGLLKNQRFYPPRVTPAPKVNPPESVTPSNNFNSSTTSGPFQFKRPAPIQDSSSKPTSLYGSLQPSSSKKFVNNGGQPQNQNSFFPTAEEQNNPKPVQSGFRTGLDQLKIDDKKKGIHRNYNVDSNAGTGRRVGLSRPANSNGTAPRKPRPTDDEEPESDNPELDEIMAHESMKNISRKMVEAVLNEVVQITSTDWDDIAGLEQVKKTIWEIIIWPMMRPDLFSGLRSAPKGILFFGPPGTGKTMFGRMIATKSQSMFFNISASSLTSKWIGEGEKMVRALFAVARLKQPSVIFIDEIDSILTQRSDTEHESSRRLKTEFLIQFDGCATQNEDRILVIGVTNRPQELDEAARRRLAKRVYIPLPDEIGRKQIIKNLMSKFDVDMTEEDFDLITEKSNGYSGADVTNLCKEASYGPLRDIPPDQLQDISVSQVRPIQTKDFLNALKNVKSSVAEADIEIYEDWNSKFGCHS